jgi:type I restriction enzyme R subunit
MKLHPPQHLSSTFRDVYLNDARGDRVDVRDLCPSPRQPGYLCVAMSLAAIPPTSANFGFLLAHDRLLDQLGALAERYFADDPSTSLLKLRQFGELLAQRMASRSGLYASADENQAELLVRLRERGYLPREISDLFHGLRKAGNAAAHAVQGDHREALYQLRMAWQLGVWFHRTFQDTKFKPGAFVPPADPKVESAALAAELQRLRDTLAAQQSAAQAAQAAAALAVEQHLSAAQRADKEAEERAVWEALAIEAGNEQARLAQELAKLQAAALASPPAEAAAIVERATIAAEALDLDEADTRRIIDEQLRSAGWEVDSAELTHGKGARPQKGKNLAIAEWPTQSGPADYVLFAGLRPLAVIEAKRQRKDVSASLEQAKRYSRGYAVTPDQLAPGGPWGDYSLPFLFATNRGWRSGVPTG